MKHKNCLSCNIKMEKGKIHISIWNRKKYCSQSCFRSNHSNTMKNFYRNNGITVKGKHWKYTEEQCELRRIKQQGKGNNNFRHGTTPQLYKLVKKVPEHRLVMEKAIGRKLKSTEVVHHWDENKKNNDIDNLCLIRDKGAHQKLHLFARRHNIPIEILKFKQNWLYAT